MTDGPVTPRRDLDPWIALPTLALVAIGFANLHALAGASPSLHHGLVARQAVWAALGLGAAFSTYRLARRDEHRSLSWLHAAAVLAVLLCLLGFSDATRGVRRWIRLGPLLVQPSEFLKITMVAALARWFGDAPIGSHGSLRALCGVVAIVSIPLAMVVAQPDLGTTALLLAIAASTLLVTPRALRSLALLAATTVLPGIALPSFVMREYQLARLRAFLDPERYVNATWQARQARAALEAGRWFGCEASWFDSHRLPDAHTDFALVSWANLHGLAGLLLVLGLYATIMLRVFDTARRSVDRFDLALVTGVGALLLWQVTLNAAMAMGLAPVVGVSLPLISYGGSNLVVTLAAMGTVLGVRARIEGSRPPPEAPGPERLYRGAPV